MPQKKDKNEEEHKKPSKKPDKNEVVPKVRDWSVNVTQRMMDRLLSDSFWEPFEHIVEWPSKLGRAMVFPKVDLQETDEGIKVTANIPGIDTNSIDIDIDDNYLQISGEINKEEEDQGKGKYYRYEREYGEFRRVIPLPAQVDKDRVTAKCKDGVLTINLPKLPQKRGKKIKIETE